jgi:hypothetical protein
VLQKLANPFWAAAAQRYARIRAVPGGNLGLGWPLIAPFAAQAGMPTDAIYMSRVDTAAVAALRAKTAAILRTGDFEPATLYVLRDEASLALARASLVPGRDLLLQADRLWVLAPRWCEQQPAPGCAARPGEG